MELSLKTNITLESLDLNFEINKARNRAMNRIAENKISIEKPSKESSFFLPKLKKLLQSIRILESFKSTNAKLGWIILTILPILLMMRLFMGHYPEL